MSQRSSWRALLPAVLLLALVGAADGVLSARAGADGEPAQEEAPAWPRLAYRALVADLLADPSDPLQLGVVERRLARQGIPRLEEQAFEVLWHSARIVERLDREQHAELEALGRDLPARALVPRQPVDLLASRFLSLCPDPREPAAPMPSGWDPERDEQALARAWQELEPADAGEEESALERALDSAPRELLAVLERIQRSRERAFPEAEAQEVAAHVEALARAHRALEEEWEALHGPTTTPARTRVKAERMRQASLEADLSFLTFAGRLREASERLEASR